MRSFSLPVADYLAAGQIHARLLFWAEARNRGRGAIETIGLWNGDQDRGFSIAGSSRTYLGAGGLIQVEPIVYATGLGVQTRQVVFSPLAAEVSELIRTHEPRLAPVELHRALFDPLTGELIEEPHRIFRGEIDEVTITTPETGGSATCTLSLVTTARTLTRTLAAKRSDAVQKQRSGDRFRRYIDVSGPVRVAWGGKLHSTETARGGGNTSTPGPKGRTDKR